VAGDINVATFKCNRCRICLIYGFYSFLHGKRNIIFLALIRRIRWTRHVALMKAKKSAYKDFVGENKERPRHRW
jgi:hypothetical protein